MIRIRICEVCGKEFAVENRSRQSICSDACRRKRYRDLRREERNRDAKPKIVEEEKPTVKPSMSLDEMARLAREKGLSYGYYEALKGKKV